MPAAAAKPLALLNRLKRNPIFMTTIPPGRSRETPPEKVTPGGG
jgi:hypothetical protein